MSKKRKSIGQNIIEGLEEFIDDVEKQNRDKRVTMKVNMPIVLEARDYHDFDDMQILLTKVLGQRVKFIECGCCGSYRAVFYIGKRDERVKQLIKVTKKQIKEDGGE